jgi:hypothetical protein
MPYNKGIASAADKKMARYRIWHHAKPQHKVLTLPSGFKDELYVINERKICPFNVTFVDKSYAKLAHLAGYHLPEEISHFDYAERITGSLADVCEQYNELRVNFLNADLMGCGIGPALQEIERTVATDCLGPKNKQGGKLANKSQVYILAVTLEGGREHGMSNLTPHQCDVKRHENVESAIINGLKKRSERNNVKWYFNMIDRFKYYTSSPMRVWIYALGTNEKSVKNYNSW